MIRIRRQIARTAEAGSLVLRKRVKGWAGLRRHAAQTALDEFAHQRRFRLPVGAGRNGEASAKESGKLSESVVTRLR
jgi:hypothetical protein